MSIVNDPVALVATFLWVGFVLAISFLEAWLKFRAPGVTKAIGLGIGRLVFKALNRVEWLFVLLIAADLLIGENPQIMAGQLLYCVPVVLLLLQTVWALPALDRRAELHIQGKNVPPSRLHLYYVILEVVKVTCLFVFGIDLLIDPR